MLLHFVDIHTHSTTLNRESLIAHRYSGHRISIYIKYHLFQLSCKEEFTNSLMLFSFHTLKCSYLNLEHVYHFSG